MQFECKGHLFILKKMTKTTTKISWIGCIVLLCSSFVGCKADIDLSEVDWTTSVNASLSLPVGSVSAKIGDFLGVSQFPQITVDTMGRYVYMDTITSSNEYHPIELEDLVARSTSRWNVADEFEKILDQLLIEFPQIGMVVPNIKDMVSIPEEGFTIPLEKCLELFDRDSFAFSLDFPIDIDLTKLNVDFNYRRVDSIIVNQAHFTAAFTQENFGIAWNDIKNVEILLSDNFQKIDSVLTLPIEGKGYEQEIPLDLQNFHLILMEDPTKESSGDNIEKIIRLTIRFTFEIDHDIHIDRNQYIGYDFQVDLIDYKAMFGYFAAQELLRDEKTDLPISELWSGWELFEDWVLPISEPSVKFEVDHTLGLPLAVNLQHLYVESKEGERRNATFDINKQQTNDTLHLAAQIAMDDPLDKRAYHTIHLNDSAERGNIDTLFSITPHTISYAFSVDADTTAHINQYRITDNTAINMKVMIKVPFAFNDSVDISYQGTIEDVKLTGMQLDSLLNEVQLIDTIEHSKLQLVAVIENTIPFKITGDFTLYNANNEIVYLSSMRDSTNTPIESSIKLTINCPDNIHAEKGTALAPSVTSQSLLTINHTDFELLETVKYITFEAQLGENQQPVCLTPDASVNIKLGITADVNAILDLKELF